MANKFWTPQTEKLAMAVGAGLSGYSILAKTFPTLGQLPEMIVKPLFGQISVLTVAAGMAVYVIFALYSKY